MLVGQTMGPSSSHETPTDESVLRDSLGRNLIEERNQTLTLRIHHRRMLNTRRSAKDLSMDGEQERNQTKTDDTRYCAPKARRQQRDCN